uniref:Xylose isomerase-like TIM barrel domain-containing protein n=2 Tax=Kalmanozyma brasiliensis (strain GHG001) TaxID=1365824 RepID=V5EWH1_KALBG
MPDIKPAAAKKRRTKKEAEEEGENFPPRPSPHLILRDGNHQRPDRRGSGLFIGAHISSAGGVENAPLNALRIGGNAFSCFVRPKMQWASNPIPDTSIEEFKHRVAQHGFMPPASTLKKEDGARKVEDCGYVVPHGCYLVNLANPDESKRDKSFEAFIDDLQRCEKLGVRLFNFHPGSMTAASATEELAPVDGPRGDVRAAKADACALVASYINSAHALTSSVVILVENMAGSKNDTILGSSLYDLAAIIAGVKDKARVGVCIDTCHAFAAGYDITNPAAYAAFTELIDTTIGWETVRALHLNDSKFPLACRRDRHANIGRGHIGIGGFWNVVNDERWNGTPLILETPALGNAVAAYPAKEGTKKMHEVWSYQIQALHALRGTKWGEWKEAEEWLTKADRVVEEAEKLHATKKKSGDKKSIPKKKAKKEEEEDSDLSSDD